MILQTILVLIMESNAMFVDKELTRSLIGPQKQESSDAVTKKEPTSVY